MTPDDVYLVVSRISVDLAWVIKVLVVLIVLVVVQVLAKFVVLSRIMANLIRVERLMTVVEGHARLTDQQKGAVVSGLDEIRTQVSTAAAAAQTAVQTVAAVAAKEAKDTRELAAATQQKFAEVISKLHDSALGIGPGKVPEVNVHIVSTPETP